jgi:hypothetical protein
MHHPSRKSSLYTFLCRFISPPTLIFLGLWNPVSYVMNYIGLSRHWHQRLKSWHGSHLLLNDSVSDAKAMRETCRWSTLQCEIWSSYGSVAEDSRLLVCYVVSLGLRYPTFRRIAALSSSYTTWPRIWGRRDPLNRHWRLLQVRTFKPLTAAVLAWRACKILRWVRF